jgi:hypothetical protein
MGHPISPEADTEADRKADTVGRPDTRAGCDRSAAVTGGLLGWGLVAGPLYVVVSLAQALTRPGFDLTRHAWSLLENGPLGWIQRLNLLLAGLMMLAFAAGVRRALGAPWAAGLLAVFGLGLVGSGLLSADPALGFPPGTPPGPGEVTWHGTGHLVAGAIGFTALVAACGVLAARFARQRQAGWAWFSGISGAGLAAGFAGVASGVTSAWTTLGLVAGVVLVLGWTTALAARLLRDR